MNNDKFTKVDRADTIITFTSKTPKVGASGRHEYDVLHDGKEKKMAVPDAVRIQLEDVLTDVPKKVRMKFTDGNLIFEACDD